MSGPNLRIAVACLLLLGMATAGEVITNGDFNGSITGWTATGAFYTTMFKRTPPGSVNMALTSGNNIYQSFTPVPVNDLVTPNPISLWCLNASGPSSGAVLVYYVGGGSYDKAFDVTGSMVWQQVTIQKSDLNPSKSINQIYIMQTSTGWWQLDDVSIQAVLSAVAEPELRCPRDAFHVAPNPLTTGVATVLLGSDQVVEWSSGLVRVFDAAGRLVLTRSIPLSPFPNPYSLDVRSLSAGVYLVRLDADACTATQKLVVQGKNGRH